VQEPARVGADGRIWLRREDAGGPFFARMILEPDLSLVAVVELDRRTVPLWSRGDTIWARSFGEYDVQVLERRVIRR
jgi:hypothetical protein